MKTPLDVFREVFPNAYEVICRTSRLGSIRQYES